MAIEDCMVYGGSYPLNLLCCCTDEMLASKLLLCCDIARKSSIQRVLRLKLQLQFNYPVLHSQYRVIEKYLTGSVHEMFVSNFL